MGPKLNFIWWIFSIILKYVLISPYTGPISRHEFYFIALKSVLKKIKYTIYLKFFFKV